MRYLSLFSGIEAATRAWAPLGWECVAVAEIEPFPNKVLAHHHSTVPNLGDVTRVTEAQIVALGHLDLVIFGSPCQDLSIAGKRKGLEVGTRSSLFFTAMQIARWSRCRFALWENVPGAFTSNAGLDFAAVVGNMGGGDAPEVPPKGWGNEGVFLGEEALVEWSTLDAQWFGVAQRRRRVFALADFGDWSGRPPILLERESLRGDSAPSRKAGEEVAGTLASSTGGCDENDAAGNRLLRVAETCATLDASYGRLQGASGQDASHGHSHLIAYGGNNTSGAIDVATARNACSSSSGRLDFESETFVVAFQSSQSGVRIDDVHATLDSNNGSRRHNGVLAYRTNSAGQVLCQGDRTGALTTMTDPTTHFVAIKHEVRRLTPRECERLQGFPDDHTLLPGTKNPDGPRYKALGNSMAVPVIRWIGRSIEGALLW